MPHSYKFMCPSLIPSCEVLPLHQSTWWSGSTEDPGKYVALLPGGSEMLVIKCFHTATANSQTGKTFAKYAAHSALLATVQRGKKKNPSLRHEIKPQWIYCILSVYGQTGASYSLACLHNRCLLDCKLNMCKHFFLFCLIFRQTQEKSRRKRKRKQTLRLSKWLLSTFHSWCKAQ